MAERIKKKKKDPFICCLQKTHFRSKDIQSKRIEKDIPCKWRSKKVGKRRLLSDFKTKIIVRDKGYYIMIKGSIQQEDITFVIIHAPNIEAYGYIKQILTDVKVELESNTIIVAKFDTPVTSIDRSSRQNH